MLGYTRKFMDETYSQVIEFAELEDFQDRPFNLRITLKEGLIKSTCADWRANFHAPRGKKSQEYFVYFKIF